MLPPAEHACRHLKLVGRVTQRLDRCAGGDSAKQWQADGVGGACYSAANLPNRVGSRLQDFDGACPVGQTADMTALLKSGYQPVDARFRRQTKCVAHLVE